MVDRELLLRFVTESNWIEQVPSPSAYELDAYEAFLEFMVPTTASLVQLLAAVAPGHCLRSSTGLDVCIGGRVPLPGGPVVATRLEAILTKVASKTPHTPFVTHVKFEELHPFTDGNGRTGRALWLWQMNKTGRLDQVERNLFLQTFYYQTLQNATPSPHAVIAPPNRFA